MNNNITKYISPKEAGNIIGVDKSVIWYWIREDKSFPEVIKIHNRIHIPINLFLEWIGNHKLK